ncbi:MAG: PepSY domain-containing protein, partial [Oscillospiraceae bacterium]|nr:PepSY domain-containing protein [Oscillospiraceae bacterium]
FEAWSVADKAWYSELTKDSLGSGMDAVVHINPGDGDVTQEQAKQIASEALRDSTGEFPGDWTVYYDFYTTPNAPDGMTSKWVISFASASSIEYYVVLDGKTGAVIHDPVLGLQSLAEQVAEKQALEGDAARLTCLEKELGPQYKWTLEDQAKYLSGHGLPREGDLSKKAAIDIATAQLETVLSKAGLNGYSAYASYLVDALRPEKPEWLVLFIKESSSGSVLSSHSVLMDAATGDVLEVHTGSNG